MCSETKGRLLAVVCGSETAGEEAELIQWARQQALLWPDLQAFERFARTPVLVEAGDRLDALITARVVRDAWPPCSDGEGRLLHERIKEAFAVIGAKLLADPKGGVSMPRGLSSSALTRAFLIYWCFEMEPPPGAA